LKSDPGSESQVSQISPGWGFIEQAEDLLFGGTGARGVKDVVIGEFYYLSDALSGEIRGRTIGLRRGEIKLSAPFGFASYNTTGRLRRIEYRVLQAPLLHPPLLDAGGELFLPGQH